MAHLRKGILFISLLSIILYTIEQVALIGLNNYNILTEGKINKIIRHEIDTKLAIFGASTAETHFNTNLITELTGIDSYNFGMDGTPYWQYRGLLKEFYSYSETDVIVIAFNAYELAKRTQIHALHEHIHHINNNNVYHSLYNIDSELSWKARNIPFYKLILFDNHGFKNLRHGLLTAFTEKKYQDPLKKGFKPVNGKWYKGKEEYKNTNLSLDKDVLKSLKTDIENMNKKNIKVILLVTPLFKDAYNHVDNLDELYTTLKSFENENCKFLDYMQLEMCNERKYFRDNTHLNISGANLFSKHFASDLSTFLSK